MLTDDMKIIRSIVGGVMVSIAPGSLVDIVPESHTALAMSFYSFGTLNGPVTGPIIVCYGFKTCCY